MEQGMQSRLVRKGLFGCAAVLGMLAAPPRRTRITGLGGDGAAAGHHGQAQQRHGCNQHTNLIGRGFPRFATLRLAECSKTNWVVPAKPCDKDKIRSSSGPMGGARSLTGFKVEACGGARASTKGLAQVCYIGVPKPSGVDTVRLVGAARIVVTFP